MNKILSTIAFGLFLFTSLNADKQFIPSKNDRLAVEYTLEHTDENTDKDFFEFTKGELESIGFFVNDPHHNVNKVYERQVGKTSLNQLSFSSMVNDKVSRPLFNKDPRIGGFTPFNLVVYRKKSDNKTVITHITPQAAIDVLQITDEDVKASFTDMFKPLDAHIEKHFKATKSYTKLHGYAKQTMMNFEIPFEEPEDIDDFFDDFQELFESTFEHKGYIIAGFYNMKYSLNSDDDVLPNYEQYVVWSLCHIPFSYTIFDGKNPMPQAAIFAPCSMYAYIKTGENKIVIGMPTLNSWAAALGITDKDKLEKINQLDTEIPSLIRSLGGVETPNKNPLK
ncbi:MAG: hypothetical protein U9Q40_10840 [Campylobacterota bacterium]|nr:hypothetical protein [Campylobacterota bacterium]